MKRLSSFAAACLALCTQAAAFSASAGEGYTLRGDFEQGAVVFGHTDPAAVVSLDGRKLLLTAKGDFVFGFDRDAGPDAVLRVALPGQAEVVKHYTVRRHEWQIQRIQGLPPKLVNPPPETEQRIADEAVLIKAAHERDTAIDDFAQPFVWPARGRVSGIFGSQRILNGEPKQAHYGVDVAVPTGTPVHAPEGGIIALAEPDLYFTGGTIIVDHGHGLSCSSGAPVEAAGEAGRPRPARAGHRPVRHDRPRHRPACALGRLLVRRPRRCAAAGNAETLEFHGFVGWDERSESQLP